MKVIQRDRESENISGYIIEHLRNGDQVFIFEDDFHPLLRQISSSLSMYTIKCGEDFYTIYDNGAAHHNNFFTIAAVQVMNITRHQPERWVH